MLKISGIASRSMLTRCSKKSPEWKISSDSGTGRIREDAFTKAQVDVRKAEEFLSLINLLYRIEPRIADLKARGMPEDCLCDLRKKKRANRARDRFFAKVRTATLLPKTPLGKALTYARNQEPEFRRYVDELRFSPDMSLKTCCIRSAWEKNYQFLGSECDGKTAAIGTKHGENRATLTIDESIRQTSREYGVEKLPVYLFPIINRKTRKTGRFCWQIIGNICAPGKQFVCVSHIPVTTVQTNKIRKYTANCYGLF